MGSASKLASNVHYVPRALIVFALLAVAAIQIAAGQSFAIRDLGALPGGNFSQAAGINNRGQVAGFSSNPPHAVLWTQ